MRSTKARTWVALGLVLALVGSSALVAILNALEDSSSDAPIAAASTTPSPSPEPRPSDLPEITGAQAKAEFRELYGLANKLTRQRDAFFVDKVFTASGPMLERSKARIAELIQDQALDHSTSRVASVKVRDLGDGEVTLLTVVHTSPCFVSELGRDLTQDKRVVRNELLWTMRWEAGSWKLHDAELRDQSQSDRKREPCKR